MADRTRISLHIKDPDAFGTMSDDLDLSDEMRAKYLEFGECAVIELVVKVERGRLLVAAGEFVKVRR